MPGPMGRRPKGPVKKVEQPGKLLGRLMKYIMKSYGIQLIIVAICIFVSVIANVQGTMFMRDLIDKYIQPVIGMENPDFGPLLGAIIRVGGFYLIGVLATFAYNRIMVYVTQGTLKNMRVDIFTHMESLPIKYFDTHPHGDIMSVYTNDIDTLRQMISQSMPQLFSSVITIVSVMVSMIILSIPLTIVTFVMIGIMLFTTKWLAGMSGKYFMAQQKDIGSVNGYIEEMMEGQKVVKVFCHEEKSLEKFYELNDHLCESANYANRYGNMLGPVNAQLGNVSYVVCAIVGGIFAIYHVAGLTLGGLASFLTFNKSINMPINQVSQQLNSIVMALAGAERIFKLLDETPEVDDGYVTLVNAVKEGGELKETQKRTGCWAWKHHHKAEGTTTYKEVQGDVVFNGVDFGYDDRKIVLHDVKLYAQPGDKIAFVGSTGAGKTTITNLINRFYDIQDGKIRYDGININKIRKSDLRRSLGIVLQDTQLFTETVMENIRYGKLDATDEEVIAAAKLANADGFIRRLPDGYQTKLTNNGANLSQGQRQLLAIARAAVADPPVLILDEATSSIDTRTEKLVQDGMDRLMSGRTTFVIAHRLSTVKNSDCIMVLEQGRIIERGTHEQLLEEQGKYYQLYTGSSGALA
ncbi:MAG: ABC transporter ATP-binding protein [Clostridia bacterium]|nr:ABC transporter ATP-binding protein [Clostridia bacterium]NCC43235.1 ABC transporter ATP-binding protein [Clostridia bacterium]